MNEPNQDLMQRITTALETAPDVQIPEDFAARVMASIPQAKRRRLAVPLVTPTHYGRSAMLAAMLVLLAAIFVFAPNVRGSNVWMILQAILLAELGALILWFNRLRGTR